MAAVSTKMFGRPKVLVVCVVAVLGLGGGISQSVVDKYCDTKTQGPNITVSCSGVPDDQFSVILSELPKGVTNLSFTGGSVKHLFRNQFKLPNLASLRHIRLQGIGAEALDNGVFDGLLDLRTLHVIGNKFYYLPKKMWEEGQLPQLRELHVTDNSIQLLETAHFIGATNVEVLDFSSNLIEFIQDDTFREMTSLKAMTLANNLLLTLHDGTFYGLKNLTYLDVSNNARVFDVSGDSSNLFGFVRELQHLNLANTSQRGVLPKDMFHELKELKVLNLSSVNLQTFPGSLLNYPGQRLEILDVSKNNINDITSDKFNSFQSLKELLMRSANVGHLDKQLWKKLPSLTSLDLSENPTINLEGIQIAQLHNLKSISFSASGIDKISDSLFIGGESLQDVDLSKNNLSHVTIKSLTPISSAVIKLYDNPWACDCSMFALKNWMIAERVKFSIKCVTPDDIKGEELTNVPNTTLCRHPVITDCCHKAVDANEGKAINITCYAWGDPFPTIRYDVLAGNPLPLNKTKFLNHNRTVFITNPEPENSGNFSCTATNTMGAESMIIVLKVHARRRLEYAEIIIIASVGAIVVFAIFWLICFLIFKQKYFVYKPYIDDDSYNEPKYPNIQVRK